MLKKIPTNQQQNLPRPNLHPNQTQTLFKVYTFIFPKPQLL